MYHFPDPKTPIPHERRWQRFYEMLPGLLTWGAFGGLIVFSFFIPLWVAIFILIYNLYWFFKAVYLSIHLIESYLKMRQHVKQDWLTPAQNQEGFSDIYQVVMYLTYNESPEMLEDSIQSTAESNYPNQNIIIVVATEEREGEDRDDKEAFLKERFHGVFADFLITTHPDGIPGEMKAKGANATHAAKHLTTYLTEQGIPFEKVIISVFDSDTVAHEQYFASLAHTFLTTDHPHQYSYQPLPMYHNNIWDAPAITRVIAMNSSFWHMMEAVRFDRLVTFSSHSMSFKTLVEVNYWPTNIVSDDSIIYWKCMDYYNGDYGVKPIYAPVSLDAVQAPRLWDTIQNQYKQMRRWAYGIEDLALVMRSYARNPHAPLFPKIRRISNMIIGHFTWATAPVLLAIYAWFPIWFGGHDFRDTLISNNLPEYSSNIMTITLLGLIITAYINRLVLPPRPKNYSWKRSFMMYAQWVLVPPVALFLGAFPAIEAQTRLLLAKYLGFWVTPKNRSKKK